MKRSLSVLEPFQVSCKSPFFYNYTLIVFSRLQEMENLRMNKAGQETKFGEVVTGASKMT